MLHQGNTINNSIQTTHKTINNSPIFHVRPSPFVTPVTDVELDGIGPQFASFHDTGTRRLGGTAVSNRGAQTVSDAGQVGRQTGRDGRVVNGRRRGRGGVGICNLFCVVGEKLWDRQAGFESIGFAVFAVTFAGIAVVGINVEVLLLAGFGFGFAVVCRRVAVVVLHLFATSASFKHAPRFRVRHLHFVAVGAVAFVALAGSICRMRLTGNRRCCFRFQCRRTTVKIVLKSCPW